ncbi:hypothetical protein FE257_004853 [Aspergillus nanangensis]|uniref:Uncharacterized protein n=1 Tax=Aspergillus nanangensis TaxID=2582783 RepID=A0AAD4CRC0_ASPNN|nr:hypothetical protein FE257_004853 [Aspergillus nanangensis]
MKLHNTAPPWSDFIQPIPAADLRGPDIDVTFPATILFLGQTAIIPARKSLVMSIPRLPNIRWTCESAPSPSLKSASATKQACQATTIAAFKSSLSWNAAACFTFDTFYVTTTSYHLNFEPSLMIDSPAEVPSIDSLADDDAWPPFLNPSPEKASQGVARRFSTATKPKEGLLRRIFPSRSSVPVLVVATSVTTLEPALDTPTSPVQFRDPFKLVDSPVQDEALSPHSESSDSPEQMTKHTATNIGPTDTGTLSEPPLRKRRAVSSPAPQLSKSEGAALVSCLSHERRNITDPTHERSTRSHSPLSKGAIASHGNEADSQVMSRLPSSSDTRALVPLMPDKMASRRRIVPSYSRADMGYDRETWPRPLSSDTAARCLSHGSIRQRPKRHSIAASDPASTIIGSDDTRLFSSGDEDETDFLSDTAFDSIRTHLTVNSSLDYRAPRIETIFDKDFPLGLAGEGPLKTVPYGGTNPQQTNVHFDPGTGQDYLSLVESCERDEPEEDSRFSFPPDLTDEEDARSLVADLPGETRGGRPKLSLQNCNGTHTARDTFFAPQKPDIPLQLSDSDSHSFTSETCDSCPKMNIFDWSEQPKNDRETTGDDARPRTVHGKHGPGARGSRAPGRKAPSTLHLRSQSVPVSRDTAINNESRQTSGKFGTWGLGSKGVSEDWDSDFEFEDADDSALSESLKPSKNIVRRGMIVPQAIMERQASLHGQFGQVQELTLLVEELKRLRHQASFLSITRGPASELWKEAEGIVQLATLDDEDNEHTPPGSPSSLTFSFDDSEGESSNTNDPANRESGGSWQESFSRQLNPGPTISGVPVKEDSSKPNSVLDLIYQQRLSHDPTLLDPPLPKSKKLPFDTQSLQDLVVRAGVVTRALKDVIRKAEGVATDAEEDTRSLNPPFSRIFDQPSSNDSFPTLEARCIA